MMRLGNVNAPSAFSVPTESEHALDSFVCACSCRRTGVHFAGTCARLAGAALVGGMLAVMLGALAAAAPELSADPGLRAVPRPPALGFDTPAPATTAQSPDPAAAATPDPARAAPPVRAGNPLWAVPLSALTVTRERPIFSSSRRAPAPPVAAAPVMQARPAPPPPPPRQPERPRLSLVGTVGGEQGIAVFVDQATQAIVRLRTGEGHDGWVLRTVDGREVTLQNDSNTAVLTMPRPDGR
jgi:general secretion pathway protein N